LVEDHLVNRQYAVQILSGLGVDVDLAGNGVEALSRLHEQRYDLVLMDCQMPEMDGYRATELIRLGEQENGTPRLPIIAITANAIQEDRQHCKDVGMDDYLSKPFTKAQIAILLQRWLPEASTSVAAEPAATNIDVREIVVTDSSLHPETIVQLREMDGDGSFLSRLIDAYLEKSPTDIEQLHQGLVLSDAEVVRKAAHSFKSSCYNLGAHQLAELCKTVEKMGRENDLEQAASLSVTIDAEYQRVREALIKIQESNNAENSNE
jgi:CheY-like chemotaxis protein/HPt (histidine-containing phosphotransfer) domain-containing protein